VSLEFHEIAEGSHRILNPFTEDKLMLLGELCHLRPGLSQLDLACGKGEMLCRWAERWGITGVGVDISQVFLEAARRRAHELNVEDKLNFVEGDAGKYPQEYHEFDIISCIGATWIGSGLVGTLELMKPALKNRDSLLVVGEPYWIDPPPPEAYAALGVGEDDYTTLAGTQERIRSAGLELLEMVMANPDTWDRYEASQWMTLSDFLRQNPDYTRAAELRDWFDQNRRAYLQYGRRYFGWGVFVLRPA
jgi:SAM-dependent methyltransferase